LTPAAVTVLGTYLGRLETPAAESSLSSTEADRGTASAVPPQ
jgi:hypothetical protein